jgi:hypothetical protein
MNPHQALELALQRQASLRGERAAPTRLHWSPRVRWRDTLAAASRARRRTGWVLVEVGLRMAVQPDAPEMEERDVRAA